MLIGGDSAQIFYCKGDKVDPLIDCHYSGPGCMIAACQATVDRSLNDTLMCCIQIELQLKHRSSQENALSQVAHMYSGGGALKRVLCTLHSRACARTGTVACMWPDLTIVHSARLLQAQRLCANGTIYIVHMSR